MVEKKEKDANIDENTHKAGDIEPIVDVIGFRIWKNDKDYIEFGRDQHNFAVLTSEVFKISEKAEES